MNYLLTAVKMKESYKKRYAINKALHGFKLLQADCPNSASVAERLNAGLEEFLNDLEPNAGGWLIISPDNLEFTLPPVVDGISEDSIYGVFGARVVTNMRRKKFIEYTGRLEAAHNYMHSPSQLLEFCCTYGGNFHEGAKVDVLGLHCLLVHSSLLIRHKLRFDEALKTSCIAEDFCLQAAKHGIASRVMTQTCRLHIDSQSKAQSQESLDDYVYYAQKHLAAAPDSAQKGNVPPCTVEPLHPLPGSVLESVAGIILPQEGEWKTRLGIYHSRIVSDNFNSAAVLAAEMMRPNSKILDIGAAFGDNGKYLKDKLNATMWGLEYDRFSLNYAAGQGIYVDLFHDNLETMSISDYSAYYRFFSHIFIGDVLEHLRDPKATLIQCSELLEPGGSFVISLPNAAHAFVSLNLLAGDFEYSANGILDSTHLRFFTAKSQAKLYAECGLCVKKSTAAFMIPGEYKNWSLTGELPEDFYYYVLENRHALSMQYICELEKSDLNTEQLTTHNRAMLDQAPENNPRGWQLKQDAYETLIDMIKEHKRNHPAS
ncbi:class I SAM-dependent methyltransferase [Desulfovibrio sp. OttesenSCG-928-C06]|nr:class I SAM-dependent methyltransferase [Desulfovibrio sp. OttesenSCG-928-C06]